ncbi:DNA/RNA helicase, superfamily II, SNF2 family [Desulfosporosinus acidiphilus SJ4]|uniref:DNA/RNA helicase, superfamily II, SNF2 family n=1 Tax=Desulfosporosinus acidiphilus (strain DSM 22704 / JCM 16185 / SJ4) TaxID=646529 RepID=I4D3D0_DESAJ|nr:DEAD/DEAH box helicase [Desulfosporosinus acidiphilus]AFM40304.1 DNA/RNA helicase, superfamily II, SNF2 family [Desulfosporosinus acidiphilus SJ4]
MIKLLPHQQSVLEQTKAFHRVAYYLDMGLGKSFVGSEKMHQLKTPFTLVICQKSKIDDWAAHFREHYDYNVYSFNKQFISEIPEHSVLVINYDLAWRRSELLKLSNYTLILDESSCIKNETRRRSKFILKLKADNAILLSGTPTGGKYEELWSQCQLLGWAISKRLYWQQFVKTKILEVGGCPIKVVTGYKNVDRLKAKLRDYGAVFMKTEEVLDLPKTMDQIVNIAITKEYRRFKKDRVIDINGKTLVGDTPLTQLLYLRQLAGMYNENKIERLTDLIQSTGDRLIVFYNFDLEYGVIRNLCEKTGKQVSVVNGKLKDLKAYEEHSDSVTLVQYQAGAMGLNLQLANKIIYFSLPLSSELWMQSKKRIHRIGQTQTCFYYYLLTKGTIEPKILETLQQRKDFTDRLFKEVDHD